MAMEGSGAQNKLHGNREFQEAGTRLTSNPKEDAVFQDFMIVLEKWLPNKDRDSGNYKDCLGLFLAREGLPYGELSQEVFESLALFRAEYFRDILVSGDVRKLIEALGLDLTAEYFVALHGVFEAASAAVRGSDKTGRLLTYLERRERMSWWLQHSQEARQQVMQDLLAQVAQSPSTPWEWLLEMVDMRKLKRPRP